MTAPTHSKQVFIARIEARATLFAEGVVDLVELLDGIEAAADQFVGAVIEQYAGESTFMAACRKADVEAAKQQQQNRPDTKRFCVAASTREAAEYLVCDGERKRDPGAARLRAWLDQRSAREVLAITEHIKKHRQKRRGQQCPTTA